MKNAPDPVIVVCLAAMAAVLYVMAVALKDESAIRETLDFRAAVIQIEEAGK